MQILGEYPFYYSWMGYLIMLFLIAYLLTLIKNYLNILFISMMFLLLVSITGLPVQIINKWAIKNTEQKRIDDFINRNINKHDIVYSEYIAYYPVKKNAGMVYFTEYSGGRGLPVFPEEQLKAINALILKTASDDSKIQKIWKTKKWIAIDSLSAPKLIIYKTENSMKN